MSRAELRIKRSSRFQDAIADHHRLALAGRNHCLLVLSLSHQLVVKGLDDGVVTNHGESWKKQLRPGMSASFSAYGCPAPD